MSFSSWWATYVQNIVICKPATFQPCLLATHKNEVIPKQAKKSRCCDWTSKKRPVLIVDSEKQQRATRDANLLSPSWGVSFGPYKDIRWTHDNRIGSWIDRLSEMRKTDCFGKTRPVPHIPSSSWAGKRFCYYCYCYYDKPTWGLTACRCSSKSASGLRGKHPSPCWLLERCQQLPFAHWHCPASACHSLTQHPQLCLLRQLLASQWFYAPQAFQALHTEPTTIFQSQPLQLVQLNYKSKYPGLQCKQNSSSLARHEVDKSGGGIASA